jgi:hypothetical protein
MSPSSRVYDDSDRPDRMTASDEVALMDAVVIENERRCARLLPCDPVAELTDPGRGGADRDDLDLNPAGVAEPIEGAVDEIDTYVASTLGDGLGADGGEGDLGLDTPVEGWR